MALPFFFSSNSSLCRISLKLVNTCYKVNLRQFTHTASVFDKIETENSTNYKKSQESKSYTVIYRNPYIRVGVIFNRTKWPQTLLTAGAIPISILLYYFDLISGGYPVVVSTFGITLTLMLYSSGLGFNKAIGFLYMSEDEKTVKLSYLNYWGKRVDLELAIEDFLYFHELPRMYTDPFYKTVMLYSRQDRFKLLLHGCHIIDREKFTLIFGTGNVRS